jgi:septation ring formation regulator EzrA
MTNSIEQPDIEARLDVIETEVATIREQLATSTQETRINSDTILSLSRTTADLLQIALSNERKVNQILQYLRDRNGGSSPPA